MNEKRKIEYRNLDDLVPYINNPRQNDDAVDKVAASISEFGFNVPIVIDKDNVIVTGHTRFKAARKLKLKEVPTILVDDLTEAQVKAFRIADNKTSEYADWDEELLKLEFEGLQDLGVDLESTGFETDDIDSILGLVAEQETDDEKYTKKMTIPQYEITGECPEISELYNTDKCNELLAEIEAAEISEEEKQFLRYAAERHNVFNYKNIAEYYAHATPEMQNLMEKSALVIIDYDNAINYGYVKLSKFIESLIDENEVDEDEDE